MAGNAPQESVATVRWEGEVLADAAKKCKEDLAAAFSSSDRVVLDLSACTQIEVPAIQLVVASGIEAANTGKKFSLAESLPPSVRRAFELAGVNANGFMAERGA